MHLMDLSFNLLSTHAQISTASPGPLKKYLSTRPLYVGDNGPEAASYFKFPHLTKINLSVIKTKQLGFCHCQADVPEKKDKKRIYRNNNKNQNVLEH